MRKEGSRINSLIIETSMRLVQREVELTKHYSVSEPGKNWTFVLVVFACIRQGMA
jgi:hypothetical protein